MYHWGIIGTGNIARRMMKSLSNSEQGKIYAVSSLTHADELKKEFPDLVVYDDYNKLLEDEHIDIVYIATRHADHYKWAKASLLHHKATLCEKPMSLTASKTKELIEIAHQENVFLMEALKTRFIPALDKIHEILDSKVLGNIQRIETCFSFEVPYTPGKYYFDEKQGGILYDCGSYTIGSILDYLGASYQEMKVQSTQKYGVDIHDVIEVIYPDTSIGYMELGLDKNRSKALHIIGDKGTLEADVFYRPTTITISLNNEKSYTETIPYIHDDFFTELEEVHQCLNKGLIESDKMTHQDSIDIAVVMKEIKNRIQ